MSFPKINPKQSFPELEEETLQYWEKEKVFEESVESRPEEKTFNFFDGPPFATGLPHYGHILQGVTKDLVPRYKTMRGYRVPRVWGWDCHGLPVENLIEKELNLTDKKSIEDYGIDKFNEACRSSVLRYAEEWKKVVKRMGRWIDMENDYKTMNPEFMESVWWVFKNLWDKGLIYEGLKPMHICPRCNTPLSNFEVGLGYKDVTDLSVIAKFRLIEEETNTNTQPPTPTYLLAWTTTPWTLPGNMALAVNPEVDYVKVKVWNSKIKKYELIILAKEIFEKEEAKDPKNSWEIFQIQEVGDGGEYVEYPSVIETIKGSELINKTYKPLFPYYSDLASKTTAINHGDISVVNRNSSPDPHKIIPGTYFITFNTKDNIPIFEDKKLRKDCAEAFREAKEKHNYKIYELVIMPNHVHLVVDVEEDGDSLPKILQQLKWYSSWKVKELTPEISQGLTGNVDSQGEEFLQLWRPGYDKKFINSAQEYNRVSTYIRDNPAKAGLPEQHYDWLDTFNDPNQPVKFPEQKKQTAPAHRSLGEGGFRIVAGDFVTTEDGTGIVHIAPAFGEDDYNTAKKENLPVIQHVSMDGKFGEEVTDFPKVDVRPSDDPRKTDQKIVKWLEEKGKLFSSENFKHSYPHCWRCDTPLLNYTTASWFVKIEEIKDRLLANNQKINWIPGHIKEGRFGKWLEGARDWAISRNRFWGAPLPIWRCDRCEEKKCIGSIEELEKLSSEKVDDLHKHFVDKLTWKCKCGGEMKRIEEVLDCWFESGSMPYAQFATKEKTVLPADFIAEAQDQTRGWFYTLHVLATALFDKPAYANCVCSGLVLAEDGQKMSKSKKNFPDPKKIFDTYGADAMRLYLMNSPVVHAEDLRFSERGVEETLRNVLLPLWNTFYFFTTYANADGWESNTAGEVTEPRLPKDLTNNLDRWILSELNILIKQMTEALDAYQIQEAVKPLASFLDGLTNWYIRRSRRRFWKSENDTDKNEAYATLLHVLTTVSKLLAPVCPFVAEKIYRDLTGEKSVHLSDWPEVDEKRIDEELSDETKLHRKIISLGHAVRARERIKTRQPLSPAIVIPSKQMKVGMTLDVDMICEELNIKDIKLDDDEEHESMVEVVVTVNARSLGPRLGKKVQECIREVKAGHFEIKEEKVYVANEILTGDEISIDLKAKEGFAAASEDGIVVILDTKITPELELEGRARDLVRVIQDLRKQADYDVSDRIELQLESADAILENHQEYIQTETLAKEVKKEIDSPDAEAELEDIKIGVKKL